MDWVGYKMIRGKARRGARMDLGREGVRGGAGVWRGNEMNWNGTGWREGGKGPDRNGKDWVWATTGMGKGNES